MNIANFFYHIGSLQTGLLVLLAILSPLTQAKSSLTTYFIYVNTTNDRVPLSNATVNLLDDSKETLCLIHGWTQNANVSYFNDIAVEFLKIRHYNVILVDWSKTVSNRDYKSFIPEVPRIGKHLATLLLDLQNSKHINLNTTHIIGHSLGAQVAGNAGKKINDVGMKLYKITGLDAAGPGFKRKHPYNELYGFSSSDAMQPGLSSSDAKSVFVFHASIAGTISPVGTLDVYIYFNPQRLAFQPGCKNQLLHGETRFDGGALAVACSHRKSYEYYIKSINSARFISHNCTSNCNPTTGTLIISRDTPDDSTGVWFI